MLHWFITVQFVTKCRRLLKDDLTTANWYGQVAPVCVKHSTVFECDSNILIQLAVPGNTGKYQAGAIGYKRIYRKIPSIIKPFNRG